jgi:predicted DCC family thiol-disulfide oxidoreductase YuxK
MDFDRHQPILFYDGSCGLCDRFVRSIFAKDRKHRLRFAPLQGKTAAKLLPNSLVSDLKTVVYFENSRIYAKSDAVIRSMARLGAWWRLVQFLRIVPRTVRDQVYDIIADRRHRIFGKADICGLLGPEEKDYFLE